MKTLLNKADKAHENSMCIIMIWYKCYYTSINSFENNLKELPLKNESAHSKGNQQLTDT